MVDISFIIVNWNTRDILIDCLNSIYKTVTDIGFEIYVVDNNSTDGSREATKKRFPDVKLIENKTNTGFAHANNQALRIMQGRFAVLLNTDAVLQEGAIKSLLSFMNNSPEAGIAGVQLLNQDGSRQNSIDNFPSPETEILNKSILRFFFPDKYPGKSRIHHNPIEVDSVVGACMMVRKEAMDEVGLFDEDYFIFLEETDWCFRMHKKDGRSIMCRMPESFTFQDTARKIRPGSRKLNITNLFTNFSEKTEVLFLTLLFVS